MILVRALYGIKTSGESWRSMFKEFIGKIFTSNRHELTPMRTSEEIGGKTGQDITSYCLFMWMTS